MTRTHWMLVAALVAVAPACKGGSEGKDSEETLAKLASLEKLVKERDTQLKTLREENAALQTEATAGGGGETAGWTFTIEGDVLSLTGKPSGGKAAAPQVDDATAAKLSEQFVGLVQGSRAAIQRCYDQALKKASTLANKTVNLKITTSFNASGGFTSVSFSPELPETFATCLRGVAAKWKLPASKAPMTFQAPIKLTPT